MCGIIGYTGELQAVPFLLEGLDALSYRGYDSAGIALQMRTGLRRFRAEGRLAALRARLQGWSLESNCGIGHTRWATHGAPTENNAHPHGTGNLMLVHNGIIENANSLRGNMILQSETDTEIAARWIDHRYVESGDPLRAIQEAVQVFQGSFALAILFRDEPGRIYAVRKGSPLILASTAQGSYLASDIPALLPYTHDIYPMKDGEIAILQSARVEIVGHGVPVFESVAMERPETELDGFAHFMLKEIYEEPAVVRRVIEKWKPVDLSSYKNIYITACGTALHAGEIGARWLGYGVRTQVASEFRYDMPPLSADDLVIVISQSGETADTLAAMRQARLQGAHTMAIVNAEGSTMAREATTVIYTHAGPEIAVASTKAYIAQLSTLYLLSGHSVSQLRKVPAILEKLWEQRAKIRYLAQKISHVDSLFFIGRGIDYYLCKEASLKLKEISYIHSEACPAGELKHGTISLLTDGTPVIVIATQPALFGKMDSNIREAAARGARVLVIGASDVAEYQSDPSGERNDCALTANFQLPDCDPELQIYAGAMAAQLLAYETALLRGCDVDKPRNLAKSVTVE